MEGQEMASQENLESSQTCLLSQERLGVFPPQAERAPLQQVSHNLGVAPLLGLEAGALLAKLEKRANRVTQDLERTAHTGPSCSPQKTNLDIKLRYNSPQSENQKAKLEVEEQNTSPLNENPVSTEALGKAERILLSSEKEVASEAKRESEGASSVIEVQDKSSENKNQKANLDLDEQDKSPLNETQMSKHALGKAERVPVSTEEEVASETKRKSETALQAGARRVDCSKEEEVEPTKEEPLLTWFPRAKKDSYLERKIKKLQESEGPKEHLGEAFVKKMSRVEREKKAAKAAAEAALAAKKAALVEVSWCRILEAAGIHSEDALVRARGAESEASKAANVAVSLGVVLSPNAPERASSFSGPRVSRGYRDVIFAATHSEADVEKEVVAAVKEALRKAKLTSAGEMRSASELECKGKDGLGNGTRLQPSPTEAVKSEGAPFQTSQPQEDQSRGVESPNGGAELPRSASKGKPPGGSRFGGLLMACLSPRARAQNFSDAEDGSSSEEEETLAPAEKSVHEEETDLEDEMKEAPLPLWGQKKIRSKAAQRYCQAADSDEDEGHVASPLRVFSPAKSPACESPGRVPGGKQPGTPPLVSHRLLTLEEDEQKQRDEARLVDEMLARVVGLTEEQRRVVGGIVAARGFAGFLENSPFLTRPEQVAKPSGLGDDFVIKRSKLEIAKAEALAKVKESEPQKEQSRAVKSSEPELGLGEVLVKRMSKLEKAKADAIAARKSDEERQDKMTKEQPTQSSAFGEDLVIHKSKLERAKEEAIAAAKVDGGQKGRAGNGRVQDAKSPAFGQDLVIHKSKLERAKEAAVSAAKAEGALDGRVSKEGLKETQTSAFGQDLVVHKFKLERAKEEAIAAQKAAETQTLMSVLTKDQGFGEGLGASPCSRGRPKQDASVWEGQGLGTLKKHLSRLERDKLAWKEAEEAAKAQTAT